MSGDVIVTVTLNAALHVAYTAGDQAAEGVIPVSRPGYRAGGRGVTVARVLRAFGHDVLAAGLAGGVSGELIREDLAKSGVPTAFTLIRGESRRFFRFAGPDARGLGPAAAGGMASRVVPSGVSGAQDGPVMRFGEPGPYITTEELGRFAADYRRLMAGAAAVVLCGSLPDGLPADTYGSLVTYAAEAGVPVILDAGGEELKHAVGHGPDLVVAESSSAEPGFAAALVRLGAGAAAVAAGGLVRAVSAAGEWTARVEDADADADASYPPARGALVAGLVPGQLLGWSWPDRLRHALALAAGGAGAWTRAPGGQEDRDHIDLAAYERLLDAVRVEPPARRWPGSGSPAVPPRPDAVIIRRVT
jgi:tagatose 6-phosphate kinase